MKKILLILVPLLILLGWIVREGMKGIEQHETRVPAETPVEEPAADKPEEPALPNEPCPVPEQAGVKITLGGFHLGMTLEEALAAIKRDYPGLFPAPIIAFDECADEQALSGAGRIPQRYRHTFLSGSEPWKTFSEQPAEIETLEPADIAARENLYVREGVRRHIARFNAPFIEDNRIFAMAYAPSFDEHGERRARDYEGADFQADASGIVTGIYLSVRLAGELTGSKNDLVEDYAVYNAEVVNTFDYFGEPVQSTRILGSGERLDILPTGDLCLQVQP